MIRKGPEMDVSDLKLLQTIYYILSSSYSFRRQMSLYEFRSFLIAELRKQNIRIEIIEEEHPLFSVNKKVILFFPDSKKDKRQIQTILLEFLISYAKSFLIAYAVQNKNGACDIRVELSDGFVSSQERGI